jgi:hypothetical protein
MDLNIVDLIIYISITRSLEEESKSSTGLLKLHVQRPLAESTT